MAFDTVMVFPGRFRDHILPDRIHMLNVSFLVPSMRRNFGGCAGNIAYNLRLLGGSGAADGDGRSRLRPVPPAGWRPRRRRLAGPCRRRRVHGAGLHHDGPRRQPDHGLSPGCDEPLAPQRRAGRSRASRSASWRRTGATAWSSTPPQFAAAGIPCCSIRARACRCSTASELLDFVVQATWVAVNDYEGQLLSERTGLSHRRDREQGACAHRHPWRRGQRDPRRRTRAS